MPDDFAYANLTGRPTTPLVRVASLVLPGVGSVHRQIPPYAALWHAANADSIRRPGARWIVLGDSMSQGIGASSFDAGWVNQVSDKFGPDDGYNIVNLSASGARVPDILEQQLPAWRSLPERDDDDPRNDLVTVLIGSNDLLRKQFRDTFTAAFELLLGELPAGTVIATLPQPRRAAIAVNALIDDAVRHRGMVIADMRSRTVASWRGKLAADHFHPNDLGYQGIAKVFHAAIANAVTKKSTEEQSTDPTGR